MKEIPFRFKSKILISFSHPTPKQQLSWIWCIFYLWMSFVCVCPGGSVVKNPPANAGDAVMIPRSRRFPEVGNGYPLQYSCWNNPMDKGDCPWTIHGQATVRGITKSWTWLSNWAHMHMCVSAVYPYTVLFCVFAIFILDKWFYTKYTNFCIF